MRTPILALLFLAASTRQAFAAKMVSPAKRAMRGRFPFGWSDYPVQWTAARRVSSYSQHASPQLEGPLATNLA
jgi:hypothetical protein